jgi:hypothetical protein
MIFRGDKRSLKYFFFIRAPGDGRSFGVSARVRALRLPVFLGSKEASFGRSFENITNSDKTILSRVGKVVKSTLKDLPLG